MLIQVEWDQQDWNEHLNVIIKFNISIYTVDFTDNDILERIRQSNILNIWNI